MRYVLQVVSGFALAGTIVPPLLYFASAMTLDGMKLWMSVATIVWFAATPFWMDRETGR